MGDPQTVTTMTSSEPVQTASSATVSFPAESIPTSTTEKVVWICVMVLIVAGVLGVWWRYIRVRRGGAS